VEAGLGNVNQENVVLCSLCLKKIIKREGDPLLTYSSILLSSHQKFALQYLLGGKVWQGDHEPYFLEEEWGFLFEAFCE